MKILRWTAGILLLAGVFVFFGARHVARRALPVLDGELRAAGLQGRVEILRDRFGVPHIYADADEDAYFALGYVHAQDRLFQLELTRHAGQGRLAELFGARVLNLDRLFRTLDFHGAARRMLNEARPEARSAADAYARGINAAVAALDGRLPPEFALLGRGFAPAQADDFVGQLGLMAWNLHYSWVFDPLYERLVAKVGPERALQLFPWNSGGTPSVHAPARGRTAGFRLTPDEWALLDFLPSLRASNNWAVAPTRSTTGGALLANDPHLSHGLPGIWYEAHLVSRTQDVSGMTLPGFPLVVLGRNRDIAWGFTNVMQDSADFFLEKLDPARPGEVMYRGEWVKLGVRRETLRVRGGSDETLEIRSTPHGPLVNHLLPDLREPVSYRWTAHAARQANEVEGLYALNRARDFEGFRRALASFGAVAQNAVYADVQGHIGLQTTGTYPLLRGREDGTRFRVGWDGSEEWEGFHPFEANPTTFDPAEGVLASANNPTTPSPGPFYISAHWEPVDRITRIRELLASKDRLSPDDLRRMQGDTLLVSARELAPLVFVAFSKAPPQDGRVRAAVELLRGFDGEMRADAAAPLLFAAFYRRLFHEVFEDELGADLARGYRSRANVSANMLRAVLDDPARAAWFDRADTPTAEDRDAILRAAFEKAVAELASALGGEPQSWLWGRLHTLEFLHPVGRASRVLGLYFNRGPFPVPGATSTVNKMEYGEDSYRVLHGPSMRVIVDMAHPDAALAVLPGGQSGLPASPHYDDQMRLWLAGEYHAWPASRPAVESVAAHRLALLPGQ
jgi:penicillin amidase